MKIISEGFARIPPYDDIDRQAHSDDNDIFLTFIEPPEPLTAGTNHFPPGDHFVISVPAAAIREAYTKDRVYRVRVTVELVAVEDT